MPGQLSKVTELRVPGVVDLCTIVIQSRAIPEPRGIGNLFGSLLGALS